MTLGRTSAGKIKIKTDGDAGLRAVECACCNPGPCGGCAPFTALTEATAITMTINNGPVSANFAIVEPFSSVQFVIDNGNEGIYVNGGSNSCLLAIQYIEPFGYGMPGQSELYVSVLLSRENDECVAAISTLGASGNFGDFSAQWQGSITVPIEDIFGTHTVPETGESCYEDLNNYDPETGVPGTICYPRNSQTTVTIS